MGLAASQARLLLLTARKSDLEYRAQQISNTKMILAMQTEELALNYSQALNNKALFYTFNASENANSTQTELLTYDSITGSTDQYRVVTADGKILCRSLEEANQKFRKDGDDLYTEDDIELIPAAITNASYFQDLLQNGTLFIQKGTVETLYDYTTTTVDEDGNEVTRTEKLTEAEVKNREDGETFLENNTAKQYMRYDVSESISGNSKINSRLDDTDDAQAEADYNYQSLIIQNKDKQLDVQLKQIETQQKACENEMESVKKILQKSIESGFKTFS